MSVPATVQTEKEMLKWAGMFQKTVDTLKELSQARKPESQKAGRPARWLSGLPDRRQVSTDF